MIMKKNNGNKLTIMITGFMTIFSLVLYMYVYTHGPISFEWKGFCVDGLVMKIDRFRGLYGLICSFIWLIASITAKDLLKNMEHGIRYYGSMLLTFVATLCIFYADDLMIVYIFFEVMSICSYVWVAQRQTEESRKASDTYLLVSVMSGLVMLMGVIILYCNLGTLGFEAMRNEIIGRSINKTQLYIGGGCLLFGFGAKAGVYPMHFYLHSAYPAAPAPAAAILSAALTKAGIFGILILTGQVFYHDKGWGMCLVILGVITMLVNAVIGLFQMDVMRILACSSVSQLGFITLGCGMIALLQEEIALAVQGTILYMVNHSMFKLILFLAVGVLCKRAGSRDLSILKGIGRTHKQLLIPVLTGCAGLAGVPLFSGYIAKTLLHESIVEYGHVAGGSLFTVIEWLFLIAGGCTLAYVSKIFIQIFVSRKVTDGKNMITSQTKHKVLQQYDSVLEKNKCDTKLNESNEENNKKENMLTTIAIWVPTVITLLAGVFPYQIMNTISSLEASLYQQKAIAYFSLENLKGSVISILIGTAIYLLVVKVLLAKNYRLPENHNLETYVYRPVMTRALPFAGEMIARLFDGAIPVCQIGSTMVLSETALVLDNVIPFLQKIGTIVLQKMAGFISSITDFFILIMQNTLFDSKKRIHREKNKDVEMLVKEISKTNRIIQASLSFGFLMVCIGLCITLMYLLLG